jgi:hypothetical protein
MYRMTSVLLTTQPFRPLVRLVVDAAYNAFGNIEYGTASKQARGPLRFITEPHPIPYLSSIRTFAGGGVGINSLDPDGENLLWFLAPYTPPSNDKSFLGLYCRTAGQVPVLVHNFEVNLSGLSGGESIPHVPTAFQYEANRGVYDENGYENPPHLRPVWATSDTLGISGPDAALGADTALGAEWFLAPTATASTVAGSTAASLGVYCRTSAMECHLVHNFTVEV